MCALKFESQPSVRLLRTTVAIIACCYLSESLVWTLRTIWGLYFCASRRLFCVGTERNVLQRHCLSPWFLCLHFRGCAVKPWCCPRDQLPWEYAMLNSKYNQFSNFSVCVCMECLYCTVCLAFPVLCVDECVPEQQKYFRFSCLLGILVCIYLYCITYAFIVCVSCYVFLFIVFACACTMNG